MKRRGRNLFVTVMALAALTIPMNVLAETPDFGWYEENGLKYWYEGGIRQGTEGRGKEIYDPSSDAWYWLDAIDGGKMAVSKDVYQESEAGPYADRPDGTGKWVRYDENGHMIKGEHNQNGSWYRFDFTYGSMVKGWYSENGQTWYYDKTTGHMLYGAHELDGKQCAFDDVTGRAIDCAWYTIDGVKYWYEGGIRQGMEGRGKEIYDPSSDAWYWLDAVDGGKMAVSKDVYQESDAGQFADRPDGTGKWVRYDENGHMIKGWHEQNGNRYYFEPVTGAMAKGSALIDGLLCEFDRNTGILISRREMNSASSNNIHDQDYGARGIWYNLNTSSVMNSYLTAGEKGGFYRVEYLNTEDRLVVEEYDANHILVNNFDIPLELDIFGGFFAGKDANFFVFGQENTEQNDNKEVVRIVKYSRDWNRQGQASLYGANTVLPFSAASLRMAETDHILYIRTGHEMYTSGDGLNHQANLTIAVDKERMEVTDSVFGVSGINNGYVSHSFNQLIRIDNDRVAAVDHGDAYPRSIVLGRYEAYADEGKLSSTEVWRSYTYADIMTFPGEIGDNYTGASVGGFEVSDSSYLIVGNTALQDNNYASNLTRNIFVAAVPKDNISNETVVVKQLTSYAEGGEYSASTPQLVEISKDKYALLWEEKVMTSSYGRSFYGYHNKVKIAFLDGSGNLIGNIHDMDASLSDCQPIVLGDRIMWYVTENSKPRFYSVSVQ